MTSARAACGALAPKAALEPSRAAGPVKGRNGRPAQEIGGGLSGRFFDPRGWTVTARLRLFKDDNFLPGGYFALDRHGVRHEIAGWSPAAAERHGRELMGRLLARGAIAARDVSVCASHERVHSPSGQHWLPTARATERDGHALYWAQRAAAIPTEPLPRGEPAFERGYRQARREFGWLTGLALTQQALTVAGLAATPIRLGSGYSIVDARSGHRIRYDWNGPRGGRERHAHGEVITATGIRGDGGVAGQVVLRPTPGSGRVGDGAMAPRTPSSPRGAPANRPSGAGGGPSDRGGTLAGTGPERAAAGAPREPPLAPRVATTLAGGQRPLAEALMPRLRGLSEQALRALLDPPAGPPTQGQIGALRDASLQLLAQRPGGLSATERRALDARLRQELDQRSPDAQRRWLIDLASSPGLSRTLLASVARRAAVSAPPTGTASLRVVQQQLQQPQLQAPATRSGGSGSGGPFEPLPDRLPDLSSLATWLGRLRERGELAGWLDRPEAPRELGNALLGIGGRTQRFDRDTDAVAMSSLAQVIRGLDEAGLAELGPDVLQRMLGRGGPYQAALDGYQRLVGRTQEDRRLAHDGTLPPPEADLPWAIQGLLRALATARARYPGAPTDGARPSAVTDAQGRPFALSGGRVTSPLLLQPGTRIPDQAYEPTGLVTDGRHHAVIPDVHGNSDLLAALLKQLRTLMVGQRIEPGQMVLSQLGDEINKGPDPAGVVGLLRGVKALAIDGGDPGAIAALDPATQRAVQELGLGRLASVRLFEGNHEDPLTYALHMTRGIPTDRFARAVADMLGKGLDNTVVSWIKRHPDAFSTEDRAWLARATRVYPVPQQSDDHRAPWVWRDPDSPGPGRAASREEVQAHYNRFRAAWIGALERTGALAHFGSLQTAAEAGGFLFFHAAPPITAAQARELREHLRQGSSLPDSTRRHLIWTRGPEDPTLLQTYDTAVAGLDDPWRGLIGGHTMGGALGRTPTTTSWFLDLGFGRHTLPMMHITPDGRVALVIAQRTPQGIEVHSARPSDFLPIGLGNRQLPNRFAP
jgi:hypothetical protein